jgi:hypothetical protein
MIRRREFLGGITAQSMVAGGDVRISRSGSGGPESAAAEELARYVGVLTGAAAGAIEDPARSGGDAYTVRSLGSDAARQVVFLGASPLAMLYAVYHYLERHCGVGFFWDGEHVPHHGGSGRTGAATSIGW